MCLIVTGSVPLAACASAAAPGESTAYTRATASQSMQPGSKVNRYTAMRTLWSQHTEWTYAAVTAFFNDPPAVPVAAARLVQNQADIGNVIKPYYRNPAGDALTKLLKQHMSDVVAVVKAAKGRNQLAVSRVISAACNNANDIGDFLALVTGSWLGGKPVRQAAEKPFGVDFVL